MSGTQSGTQNWNTLQKYASTGDFQQSGEQISSDAQNGTIPRHYGQVGQALSQAASKRSQQDMTNLGDMPQDVRQSFYSVLGYIAEQGNEDSNKAKSLNSFVIDSLNPLTPKS